MAATNTTIPGSRGAGARRLVLEALLVAVLGVCVALAANFISPRGLSLTRNYFPTKGGVGLSLDQAPAVEHAVRPKADINPLATTAPPAASRNAGITTITTARALELFRAPAYEQELTVFVDARSSKLYEAGHVPGAYQLDRYYPENHLPAVLPACLNATRVVVYCTGGECEDSHFAAQLLQEAGVPADVLSVYTDGITEWEAQRLPIETGARNSGILRESKP